jgi:cytoskeletal protein CcmA (bactofilin family)
MGFRGRKIRDWPETGRHGIETVILPDITNAYWRHKESEMKKNWRSRSEISAFIGLGAEFSGVLNFEGVIRLDGRFSGEINSKGTLIVGDTAQVAAEINVDTVVVSGEIHGNIRASNRVQLHAPAKHYGNIISPVVTIDEGVVFEGNCHMHDPSELKTIENTKKKVTLISKEGESEIEAEIL